MAEQSRPEFTNAKDVKVIFPFNYYVVTPSFRPGNWKYPVLKLNNTKRFVKTKAVNIKTRVNFRYSTEL